MAAVSWDALVILSFGGPRAPEEVMPFLESVTGGRVPAARLATVAEHYHQFGGRSPIDEQTRALAAAVAQELERQEIDLPVRVSYLHAAPRLSDVLRELADAGASRVLCFVTSGFSSYSGCRKYLEAIDRARLDVGAAAPEVHKLRLFYNHPGFVAAVADRVQAALAELPDNRRAGARIVFTAHSIPVAMSDGCAYVDQLDEACRLVADEVGHAEWQLVYQSRSGPPDQAWLEPDVLDHLRVLERIGAADVVLVPIGFVSDHMEVVYDLDVEARGLCDELGIGVVRAGTVGTHPRFVSTVVELVRERLEPERRRRALGTLGTGPDECAPGCCPRG